jgi:predicted transcriptional regulator
MIYGTSGPSPGTLMPDNPKTDTVTPDELRELAAAMGCHTQKDLAEVLGVTQPRVSQILSGAHPVKPGPLLALIRQLQAQHVHRKGKRS